MSPADSVFSMIMEDEDSIPQEGVDSTTCDSCNDHQSELFFCNVCSCIFCAKCWNAQFPHKAKSLGPGGIPHEKTDIELAQRIQEVFSKSLDDSTIERLHAEDQRSAWLGEL
jgi:hypothetical protein